MRRYLVDSVEEDEMAYKSSQSLRHSEHSSPQLESSQCSAFDIYSQVMSQQQGLNSQSSEAPQIAQKYYTKFSSKPSLFKGKEAITLEKNGLTRRRSFQDIHEFQNQRARDKEDRDLIGTLVSLLKECTDEVQQTAEKVRSDLRVQVADASVKLEDAIKKMHSSLHEFKSELSCSVNDKLESRQSSEELQANLKEKEAVLQTLKEELVRTKAMKHDEFKSTIQEICSIQQKDILLELKLQKETCDIHYLELKESITVLFKDLVANMEDKFKTQLQKVVEECSTELMKKSVNEQHGNSHSSSAYQGNASIVPVGLPVNNVQTTSTTSRTNLDYTLPTGVFGGPNIATVLSSIKPVVNSVGLDQTFNTSSEDCVVPGEDVVTSQSIGTNPLLVGTSRYLASDRRYGYPQHKDFLSPPNHPQSSASTNTSSHFSRWTSKGPSPVAAVAPLVHAEVAKEQRYTPPKRHNNGLRKVRYNYQPIRRQSARLKQKNLKGKVLPMQTVYAEETSVQKPGYADACMTKMASKSRVSSNASQLQMTKTKEKRWEMDNMCRWQEAHSHFSSSRSPNQRNPLSKVQSNKPDSNALYADLCKRQRHDYRSSQKRSRVVTDKGFMAVSRNEPDYIPDSEKSSPGTTLFSGVLEDPASQDLFIDAIDDHMYTSDEEYEMRTSNVYTRSPASSKQMDTLAEQKSRTIKRKRTLWSSGSSQNRDLLSFLTSAIKQRANMV